MDPKLDPGWPHVRLHVKASDARLRGLGKPPQRHTQQRSYRELEDHREVFNEKSKLLNKGLEWDLSHPKKASEASGSETNHYL
jgi:hypothetical protein